MLIHIVVEIKHGYVLKVKRDEACNLCGIRHKYSILDTHEYIVEFDDGELDSYTMNTMS